MPRCKKSLSLSTRVKDSSQWTLLGGRWLLACLLAGWGTQRAAHADDLIQQAIAAARQGNVERRNELISRVLADNSESAGAHWLRGEFRTAEGWRSIADSAPQRESTLRAEYERLRGASDDTAIDQWKLAQWCATHKLTEQGRVHLMRVVELDPTHAAAHKLLGDVLRQGLWYSSEQLAQQSALKSRLQTARDRWSHEVNNIRSAFASSGAQARETAQRRLDAIDDVDALPLLKDRVATLNSAAAEAVVKKAATFHESLATAVLCRLAGMSGYSSARLAAIDQLRQRRQDAVIPALLDSLHSPAAMVDCMRYTRPDGFPVVRIVLEREEANHFEYGNFDTVVDTTSLTVVGGPRRKDGFLSPAGLIDLALTIAQKDVANRNTLINQENQATCSLLRELSGQTSLSDDPKDWWQWWNDQTETWPSYKPTISATFTQEYIPPPVYLTRLTSCFVAGTLVWTPDGSKRIEQVKVGDMVLAQHPETGELAFKVVLQPTRRWLAQIIKLGVGDEELQTSGGHLFWVADQGWQRARSLAVGDELAGVGRVLPVVSAEATMEEAPMYNLVVADFHTYFVGNSRVLVHDITRAVPLNNALPGWEQQQSGRKPWAFTSHRLPATKP